MGGGVAVCGVVPRISDLEVLKISKTDLLHADIVHKRSLHELSTCSGGVLR